MLILGLISAVPSGLVFLLELQSRTESPQAPWPSVGREERPWGTIKSSYFLLAVLSMACIVLRQKPCGNKIPVP